MISKDGEMAKLEPEAVAGKATAESGVVLLDGPGGVAVALRRSPVSPPVAAARVE